MTNINNKLYPAALLRGTCLMVGLLWMAILPAQTTITVNASGSFPACGQVNGVITVNPSGGDGNGSGYDIYVNGTYVSASNYLEQSYINNYGAPYNYTFTYPLSLYTANGSPVSFPYLINDIYDVQVFDADDDPNPPTFANPNLPTGTGVYANSSYVTLQNGTCSSQVQINSVVDNTSACNSSDGEIDVYPTGGDGNTQYDIYIYGANTGPYSSCFSCFNDITYNPDYQATGLSPDIYTVAVYTVDDDPYQGGLGLYGNSATYIVSNPGCQATISTSASSSYSTPLSGCNTNDGSITVTLSNTPSALYDWYLFPGYSPFGGFNPISVTTNGSSSYTFSNLSPGFYTAYVNVDNGSFVFGPSAFGDSITLYVAPSSNNSCGYNPITISYDSSNLSGCNTGDGWILAGATGGLGGTYNFLLYNNNLSLNTGVSFSNFPGQLQDAALVSSQYNVGYAYFTGLSAGAYTVVVQDYVNDAATYSNSNGGITYDYAADAAENVDYQPVVLYNSFSCPNTVQINATVTNICGPFVAFSNSGSITVNPTGGDGNGSGYFIYVYGATNGNNYISQYPAYINDGDSYDFSSLPPDDYTVRIYDADQDPDNGNNNNGAGGEGIDGNIATYTVSTNPVPDITLGSDPSVCSSASSQTADLSYSATTGSPDQYSITGWSGGGFTDVNDASLPSTPISIAVPAAVTGGIYTATLTVTNSSTGCVSGTYSISVTVNSTPIITGTTPGSVTCSGTVNLGATASAGTVNWYTLSSGGSSVHTGTSYTTPSISTTTDYYVDATASGCTTASRTEVTATVSSCGANTWLGGATGHLTDWATAANWSYGTVPVSTDDVLIPVTTYAPVIGSSTTAVANNLTVDDAVHVTVSNGGSLTVGDNYTGGSATNAIVDEISFSGGGGQTMTGLTQFGQVSIDDGSGVVITRGNGNTQGITGVLNLVSGQFTTNGNLVLISTSVTSTGIIDNFTGGYSGTISGDIVAQRYYGAASATNDFNQHMLGLPVAGNDLSVLGANGNGQYYIPATTGGGSFNNNCNELLGAPGTPYGNVFGFNEAHVSDCIQQGWLVEATSTPASTGIGYSVILNGGGAGTIAVSGAPNLNTGYNPGTTNTGATTSDNSGTPYPSGINLLSNPFPASLDVSKLIGDNGGYDAAVYVWNTSTGSYYQPTTIAPFQAFKVLQIATGAGSYAINRTSETLTAGSFQKTASPSELNLTVTNITTGLTDETTVGFNPAATTGFDQPYDVIKLAGAPNRHTLYSLSGGNWMWRNILNSISQTSTVPVGFEPGVSGTYNFTFDGIVSFDPTSYIMLEDKQTGVMHDVRSGTYTFTSNAGDNFNRFVLHFTPAAIINTTGATCYGPGLISIVQPGSANWNYTLSDNNNTTISSGIVNVNTPLSASVTTGVYTLTLSDVNGYTVVKTIEVDGAQTVLASFTASLNTVPVNQEITMSSTSNGAVVYNWNFGDGSTDNGAAVTHTYNTEGVYTVTLNTTNASGCTSSASHNITVTSQLATGVTDLNNIDKILIWSNEDMVNIDFTQMTSVEANIEIYNILGQKIVDDKYTTSTVYRKEIPNVEAGYIVVSVKNGDAIINKKLFINNLK